MNRISTHTKPSAAPAKSNGAATGMTRQKLIDLLNKDLAREYQAVIAYVVYSQVLKGAAYMNIAAELEKHASEELQHALIVAKQIDYLGGTPTVEPKAVKMSDDSEGAVAVRSRQRTGNDPQLPSTGPAVRGTR